MPRNSYQTLPKTKNNMKTLIVYYSRTWTTKKVAQTLSNKINADLFEIIDKKDRRWAIWWIVSGKDATLKSTTEIENININLEDYELVIIWTPVRAWLMTPAVRTFIQMNKGKLKKIAVFATQIWNWFQRYKQEFEEIFENNLKNISFFMAKNIKNNDISQQINEFIKNID